MDTPAIYASCNRCKAAIQLAQPLKRNQGLICNSCFMKWTEIRDKLVAKGSYQDEIDNSFVKFVNDLAFLKKYNF